MSDCANFNGLNGCGALEKDIVCNKDCPFRKTQDQVDKALASAHRRLASLPNSEQQYIADKYYHGKRIWNKRRTK